MNIFKLLRLAVMAVLLVVVIIWGIPIILRYIDLLNTMSR